MEINLNMITLFSILRFFKMLNESAKFNKKIF